MRAAVDPVCALRDALMASPSLTAGVPERGATASTGCRAPPSGSPAPPRRSAAGAPSPRRVVESAAGAAGASHPFERAEARGLVAFLNLHAAELGGGPRLPIGAAAGAGDEDDNALFAACADGVLLCRLVNLGAPHTVDERALNLGGGPASLSLFQKLENVDLALSSARAVGASVVNTRALDVVESVPAGRQYLVLGLLWQLARAALLARVTLTAHPELAALGADAADLSPEALLVRWANYHLPPLERVGDLHHDLRSGVALCRLLSVIAGTHLRAAAARAEAERALALPGAPADAEARATAALAAARLLGVEPVLTAGDVVAGRRRLLLAFVAQLFNALPALPALRTAQETESRPAASEAEVSEGLELDSMRAWLRSLDLGGGAPATAAAAASPLLLQSPQLCADLASGATLLRALEAVAPGATTADERRRAEEALAAAGPRSTYVQLAACSAFVAAARRLGLSLPGTSCADIHERNLKLVLGAAWQLRRRHLVGLLQREGERAATDADVLAWAAAAAARSELADAQRAVRDLRDVSPKFLLRVLSGAFPGLVSAGLATGADLDDARLALSLARKAGVVVFGVAEELVARSSRAAFAFLAAAMHRASCAAGSPSAVEAAPHASAPSPARSAFGSSTPPGASPMQRSAQMGVAALSPPTAPISSNSSSSSSIRSLAARYLAAAAASAAASGGAT